MDALGIQKASVAGSSVGGSIVIALGARHAARMERVFIVEYPIRTEQGWAEGWAEAATDQPRPINVAASSQLPDHSRRGPRDIEGQATGTWASVRKGPRMVAAAGGRSVDRSRLWITKWRRAKRRWG
jgi:pimeloyl-ACP methyl ester carboxylesterase